MQSRGIQMSIFRAVQKVVLVCGVSASALLYAAPDEESLGKSSGYPVGNIRNWTQPQYRIGSWSAPQKIEGVGNTRIDKSSKPFAILKANLPNEIKYRYGLNDYTIDQYFDRQKVTSLQILKDGKLLIEKYQYDRGPDSRFISYSMAKSVTSLLLGIAVDKGVSSHWMIWHKPIRLR
jgi:hypothetical protein